MVSPTSRNRSRRRRGSTPAGWRTTPSWSSGSPGGIASGGSGPTRCGGSAIPSRSPRRCSAAGIPAPEVRVDPRGLPRDGSWLVKPRASGGGIGVEPYVGQEIADLRAKYLQRRIEGLSFSALFIGSAGRARLVGVARQWIGGVPGRPFAYRGGIGPWRRMGPAPTARLSRAGRPAGLRLRPGRLVRRGFCAPRRHPLAGRGQPAVHGVGRDPRAGRRAGRCCRSIGPPARVRCEPAADLRGKRAAAIPGRGQVDRLCPAAPGHPGEHVGRRRGRRSGSRPGHRRHPRARSVASRRGSR